MNQINSRVILNTLVSSAVLSVKKSGLVRSSEGRAFVLRPSYGIGVSRH